MAKGHLITEEEKQAVITMYNNGIRRHDIATAIGRSYSFVTAYLLKCGHPYKENSDKLYSEMREYKAQGHTAAEVAERFRVSKGSASKICVGIAPQTANYSQVSKTLIEHYERERGNRIERLKEKLDDAFEYVGGYDGSDGYVTIRCKQCGTEFERSAQAIRKRQVKYCPCCRKEQTERNAEQREREREERNALRDAERERKRQETEQRRIENTVTKVCRMCGNEFDTVKQRQVFCSSECSHLWMNRRSYNRIPKDKRIDKGINALSLFKRDNGVCWICGGKCDLNDYTTRNGVFIAGDWYPSVDHIMPICDGGEDAWDNVKLAHRICNSRRFYAEKTNPIA